MKMLFITERYMFVEKPEIGLSNTFHNLIGSWECADLGKYKHVCISHEPGDVYTQKEIDDVLLNEDYDYAFLTPYNHLNCSYATASKLGKKLILGWWDALRCFPDEPELQPSDKWWEYADCGVTNIIFDCGKGNMHKNTWAFETPQDVRIFYPDPNVEEDIDVSFVGAVHTRHDRAVVLNMLVHNRINVWHGGGRALDDSIKPNLSIGDYVNIHRRSKICLNFQTGWRYRHNRKGRGFEIAACGKFMMADNHRVLDNWFQKDVHFVDFDKDNVVLKINYYLNRPELRKNISKNLYDKYINNYSPKHFWKRVLDVAK